MIAKGNLIQTTFFVYTSTLSLGEISGIHFVGSENENSPQPMKVTVFKFLTLSCLPYLLRFFCNSGFYQNIRAESTLSNL